jgi:hypothetical protein
VPSIINKNSACKREARRESPEAGAARRQAEQEKQNEPGPDQSRADRENRGLCYDARRDRPPGAVLTVVGSVECIVEIIPAT